MAKKYVLLSFILYLLSIAPASAMVFDNRYIPLLQHPWLVIEGTDTFFSPSIMIGTASRSFNERQAEIGLPEIYGFFDQAVLAKSMIELGFPNPLPSEWQGEGKIPWALHGKMQVQGINVQFAHQPLCWLSFGFSFLFMRVNSWHQWVLGEKDRETPNIFIADQILLGEVRRDMFTQLGLDDGHVAQTGFGDIDAFIRFGYRWEYTCKFKRVDAGVRIGGLAPTGVTREINNPPSIAFGGDGFWGMYAAVDALFELKEDWKVGALVRVNKRFPKTRLQRISVETEPAIFGAALGEVRINPGVTAIFEPFFIYENLREGLGVGLYYTLIAHQRDSWCDARPDKTVPVNLLVDEDSSKWTSEYVTLNVFYDFGKRCIVREFDPIISFNWDIPVNFFMSSRSFKTHLVTIGVQFAF